MMTSKHGFAVALPLLLIPIIVGSAQAQGRGYANPLPSWMQSAYDSALTSTGPITDATGNQATITPGPLINQPGATYGLGTSSIDIVIDVTGIAGHAGMPAGYFSGPDDETGELRELLKIVLGHEKGHVNGTVPRSGTNPCGHAQWVRDNDAFLICCALTTRKQNDSSYSRMCEFYAWLRKTLNGILTMVCGPSEPLVPSCAACGD